MASDVDKVSQLKRCWFVCICVLRLMASHEWLVPMNLVYFIPESMKATVAEIQARPPVNLVTREWNQRRNAYDVTGDLARLRESASYPDAFGAANSM